MGHLANKSKSGSITHMKISSNSKRDVWVTEAVIQLGCIETAKILSLKQSELMNLYAGRMQPSLQQQELLKQRLSQSGG